MLKIKAIIFAIKNIIRPKTNNKHNKELAQYPILQKLNILSDDWKSR